VGGEFRISSEGEMGERMRTLGKWGIGDWVLGDWGIRKDYLIGFLPRFSAIYFT